MWSGYEGSGKTRPRGGRNRLRRHPPTMQEVARKIGLAIAVERQEKQLTQAALARRLRLTRSQLSSIERGKVSINWTRLGRIARALRVQLGKLILRSKLSVHKLSPQQEKVSLALFDSI
jgi:transcriptional regulator with XRE-family HTH domain